MRCEVVGRNELIGLGEWEWFEVASIDRLGEGGKS